MIMVSTCPLLSSPADHYHSITCRSLPTQGQLVSKPPSWAALLPLSHLWEHLLLIRAPAEGESHTELLGPPDSFLDTTALISVGCIPQGGKGDGGGVGVLGE